MTFDPYSSLSLPLPTSGDYEQKVCFVPSPYEKDATQENLEIVKFKFQLSKRGHIKDLISAMAKKANCSPNKVRNYYIGAVSSLFNSRVFLQW